MLYTVKLSDEQLAQDIQEANTNDLLNSVGLGKWTLTELKEATPAAGKFERKGRLSNIPRAR